MIDIKAQRKGKKVSISFDIQGDEKNIAAEICNIKIHVRELSGTV